jgi:glycosyltransferase involved in cell wall biosynthesis
MHVCDDHEQWHSPALRGGASSASNDMTDMKMLILAAGRFNGAVADQIASGREPRLDVFELQRALGVPPERMLDFGHVESSQRLDVRLVRRTLGLSAAVAYLAIVEHGDADAFFTTGEDIGLPLSLLLKLRRARASHTMIAHSMGPRKKRVLFAFGARRHLDRILCYATLQERLIVDELKIPQHAVERIAYHADERFFCPQPHIAVEPDLICSAGQLLRDYDTLMRATEDLPVRVRIAAGSPWIAKEQRPNSALPANVDWQRYGRFELRELYARSALAIVPIVENDYQTGISTILEMMAMGKCVVATRTRGQTDTIVDDVTGVYVPPGDAAALRATIQRLLANPAEIARIGSAARAYVEQRAGLDLFVRRVAQAVHAGHASRFGGGSRPALA